jgi:hypothetical protein
MELRVQCYSSRLHYWLTIYLNGDCMGVNQCMNSLWNSLCRLLILKLCRPKNRFQLGQNRYLRIFQRITIKSFQFHLITVAATRDKTLFNTSSMELGNKTKCHLQCWINIRTKECWGRTSKQVMLLGTSTLLTLDLISIKDKG